MELELTATELIPEKNLFKNISLSVRTVAWGVENIWEKHQQTTIKEGKWFHVVTLALDEATDTTSSAQLCLFQQSMTILKWPMNCSL